MNDIFCLNSNCKNYSEDTCLCHKITIGEYGKCESFVEGENEIYKNIVEYNKDDVKRENHYHTPYDIKIIEFKV